jgi:hypothetical protein
MQILKSTLFTAASLCLLAALSAAQVSAPCPAAAEAAAPMTIVDQSERNTGPDNPYHGFAGGPSLAWHNFRQHRTANDIAPGLVLTWDLPLAAIDDDFLLSARPGLSYLHPAVLIDAVLRMQYLEQVAVIAGFSIDPTGDREFLFEESTPEWRWMNEHDSFGKRSFALLGLQIPTSFAYYEFLYRIQLEKGSHAYYTDAARSFSIPAGYRRYFILSVGMGIWL